MSVAEKTPRTRLVEIPASLLKPLQAKYGEKVRLVEPDDEELIDFHESDWHKEMSATRTPGRALRVYRDNRGLSQTALAKKLGETISKQYVADMEAGRRSISKEMAKKLAVILNAPVARFL